MALLEYTTPIAIVISNICAFSSPDEPDYHLHSLWYQ